MLEVCVDSFDGACAALDGGAHRVELCSSLSEGGLTPSLGLMRAAATLPIPCYAMIRPRSGLFHFSGSEAEIMQADVAAARDAGLAGVVLGAQSSDDTLNAALLARLVAASGEMGRTLHRVIDVVPDPLDALRQAIELGFDRVLTSGAQPLAPDGVPLIREMVQAAKDRISVMPGCGLDPENVRTIVQSTGATEIHAACCVPAEDGRTFSDFDPPGGRFVTSAREVERMVLALAG